MTSGDHESVKLALQSLQAQTALPAGEIIIRHIELGKSGNKIAYATIGSQPIIVRSPNAKDVQMFTEPLPFQDEITCSAVFTVGNHDHYFAIGCADGSVGVFYANPSSPNLKVISYFTPSKGVNGVSNNTFKQAKDKRTQGFTGPPIQALHFVPLTCLKRFQDSIVYLWISTDVSLFLGVFRKSTEGPIKCILTTTLEDITIAKSAPDATSRNGKPSTATKAFPRLLNCEYLHTSLGQNTCMVLHFLCGTTAEDGIQSTVATGTAPIQALEGEIRAHHVSAAQSHVRIIALDLRLVLHIAEKVRLMSGYYISDLSVFLLTYLK